MGNRIFVIDDNIPASKVEGIDDSKPINPAALRKMLQDTELWDEKTLVGLFEGLLSKESGNKVIGFTHPEICLQFLEKKGQSPEIVIYDWDFPSGDPKDLLLELLQRTKPKVLISIYTRYDKAHEISDLLKAEPFKEFEPRLKLVRKDDDNAAAPAFISKLKKLYTKLTAKKTAPSSPKGNTTPPPNTYTVWYATNRKPVSLDILSNGFGSDRDKQLHYGKSIITVPSIRKFGSKGSGWIRRKINGEDDRILPQSLIPLSESSFWTSFSDTLTKKDRGDRVALLFIHGYNVSFNDALIQAAQLGCDLNVPGATALFSWPSHGGLLGYLKDQDSVEYSETYLAEFLEKFAESSGAETIHVIAHSMGNKGLLRALDRTTEALSKKRKKLRLGQVVLAAPDVDVDLFTQLSVVYKKVSTRTTLYVSSEDKALKLSGFVRGTRRVGYGPPIGVFANIDTIDASDLDLSFLGHGYYAAAEAVIADIFSVFQNLPPNKRNRLQSMSDVDGGKYWLLKTA